MTEEKIKNKLDNYKRAVQRLEEALAVKRPNQFVYDSVIKRFEFTYEQAWKLLKAFIEYKGGADVKLPRDIFKEAYAAGLLSEGEVWLEMIKDRNLTSHTYDEENAREIYRRVKVEYLAHFQELVRRIEGEFE